MLIKKPSDIPPSEITDKEIYHKRRHFMRSSAGLLLGGSAGLLGVSPAQVLAEENNRRQLDFVKNPTLSTTEELTALDKVTSYNNFYEFGTDKYSPAKQAKQLTTTPWNVEISGEVNKPGNYQLEDILKSQMLEERIYRLRCVERWSMVVPWVGFSLAELLKQYEPTSRARYVEFTTLHRPEEMPGQKRGVLHWPYVEGLRIDEAMHPLSMLVVGLYGEILPNQNGAPLRLVVPWKYGFKSIKSIVKIRLTEKQPVNTWQRSAPHEYGFYANVNPQVDHPRWSQKRERRLGDFLKRKTLMFNGYAEQVASLYNGMDLRKYF